ncbi:MAG: restriction endonuclease [archaeon]
MINIFSEIEDNLITEESIIFDEEKIKKYVYTFLIEKLNKKTEIERPFYFEQIVYDFFEYMNIKLIKSKKTRDFGIDGIIRMNIGFFGEISLGLQIKHKLIDSNDIDLFLSALKNSELQLGVVVCKDSRKLEKYELNSKIKAILFSKGIKIKEKLIKEKINLNPVFILKFDELINIVALTIRAVASAIYKK